MGIIVDAEGQPTRSALTFPSLPRTLAAAGLFVVSAAQEVCTNAGTSATWGTVHSIRAVRDLHRTLPFVYQPLTRRKLWWPLPLMSVSCVQGLSVFQWGDATCVQRLGYGSAGFPSPGEGLLTADGPPGGSIALAGHRKVRCIHTASSLASQRHPAPTDSHCSWSPGSSAHHQWLAVVLRGVGARRAGA